jgi:hypothetical protein
VGTKKDIISTVELDSLPRCDVCEQKGARPVALAKFNSYLSQYNTHGYTCPTHFREYGAAPATRLMLAADVRPAYRTPENGTAGWSLDTLISELQSMLAVGTPAAKIHAAMVMAEIKRRTAEREAIDHDCNFDA